VSQNYWLFGPNWYLIVQQTLSMQELEVWLHFDAKYRVDNLLAQMTSAADSDELSGESTTSGGEARRPSQDARVP
jgi:hypothetical protein